jgi:hypothetical protein
MNYCQGVGSREATDYKEAEQGNFVGSDDYVTY